MENILFKQSALCQPCRDVISLTQIAHPSWEELLIKAPQLPRGWFELSQLSSSDRIEFTFLFWRSKWEIKLSLEEEVSLFFNDLEEIEIFLVQNVEGGSYAPLMLYTLKEGKGFFFASTPASVQDIARLRLQFSEIPLPEDYLTFLSIHDGFGRDSGGGLIKMRDFAGNYSRFQQRLSKKGALLESAFLIPFCEFENAHSWQCFYRKIESNLGPMRNGYFNELLLEDVTLRRERVFASFSEWLLAYVHGK